MSSTSTRRGLALESAEYQSLLARLKERVRSTRFRAALSVNREIVLLYWEIGREILARQEKNGWGAKVVGQLSKDLREAFPEIKGFSARNLKYMRAFAAAWPDAEFVQQAAAQIPWFHNCVIVEYALRNTLKPIGVSEWQLTRELPDSLVAGLPRAEVLEAQLKEPEDSPAT